MILESLSQAKSDRLILASGFFDPITPAHLDYLRGAKQFQGKLLVIVNDDQASIRKKGYYFFDVVTRCLLLEAYGIADYILPCPADDTSDVIRALKPYLLTQGGDRREDTFNQKEIDACIEVGAMRIYGVGGTQKVYASSKSFKEAVNMYLQSQGYGSKKTV